MKRIATILLAASSLIGCGGNAPPSIDPLADETAYVNVELALTVTASDPDGDELNFRVDGDLEDIARRASLSDSENRALFLWTPLASDVGAHSLDFEVSDGELSSRTTLTVNVELSEEGAGAPAFIQPLGTGTTVDVRVQSCVEVPILVQDPDSPGVSLAQEEPLIEGAMLSQTSELAGSWQFCPTPEQIDADDRYTLALSADDGEHDKTLKSYLIVLLTDSKTDCPGEAPVITHAATDVSTVNDVVVTADVSDDQGIKYEPLLYYSTTPPSDPPDVTQMTQLTMTADSGDMLSGTWSAAIPNPVASQPQGSTAQLYYVIVAQDNDDAEGTCDHRTSAPATGSFAITVTNPGGSGGLGLCASCTADAQCGGSDDLCIFLDAGYHCFEGCMSNNDCAGGYYCSFSSFTSIDNASGRQCIPNDYMCDGGGMPSCVDDSFEQNDSLSVASSKPALTTGTHSALKSCPASSGDDEDWYKLTVTGEQQVALSLSGGSTTDLDLALYTAQGTLIDKSDSLSSSEALSQCLTAGTYYARVYAYGSGENTYSLTYSKTTTSCGPTCQDDSDENDDNALQARMVDLNVGTYTSLTNAICSMDDDWYAVPLFNGETVYVTLTFAQTTSSEDLDIYFYQGTTNLTGCDESTPLGCDPFNGQSGSSNESMAWPINQTGTYYVVVHGWNGSENLYDICIGLSSFDCP